MVYPASNVHFVSFASLQALVDNPMVQSQDSFQLTKQCYGGSALSASRGNQRSIFCKD